MNCRIEVVAAKPGISIWCATCCENVAWDAESFTEAEVVATAEGHRQVMAKARKAAEA